VHAGAGLYDRLPDQGRRRLPVHAGQVRAVVCVQLAAVAVRRVSARLQGESCAKTSVGRNDTCAGKSTSCQDCKADMQCNWCGSTQGCRPNKCDDGSSGMAFCASCARLSECNGAGECIGPDQCRCMTGFKADATLGCVPADQAAPQPTESGDSAIAIYAGAGAGACVLLIIIIIVVVVLRRKKDSSYTTVMSPVASTNMDNQPAVGMFNCNICGKSYNFQSDLETHTAMRHGDGAGSMGGDTFANQSTGFGGDTMMNGGGFQTAAGGFDQQTNGFDQNGGSFGGDPYGQQQFGSPGGDWNSGASFDNGGQNWNNSGQQW
jgi:hypothetical protein